MFCCYFFLMAGSLLSPTRLETRIELIKDEPAFEDAVWGIAVYAPLRHKYLYRHNAHKNFRTASNMKILTSLLAFDWLGPEYRFETEFAYTGRVREDILEGDLVVRGGGDPSISGKYSQGAYTTEDLLRPVLDRIQALGVRHIRGDLVAIVDFFDEEAIPASWEWDDVGRGYATPVTPLSLNDGHYLLELIVDEEGRLQTSRPPTGLPGFRLETNLTHETGAQTVKYRRTWGTDLIHLTGNLPPCDRYRLTLSAWNPTLHFLETLKVLLTREGITVAGTCRVGPIPEERTPVTLLVSDHLSVLGRTLMKSSQNHYADLLLKTTARHVTGEGSFAKGFELAAEWLEGLAPGTVPGLNMRDGSGLSTQDYLRPDQVIAMLSHAWLQPFRKEWLATFPVMGTDGTLEHRGVENGKAIGRVWAKTGYIYRTRNLSGYTETLSGEPLFFSIMVNNYGVTTFEINRAQDRICELLIRLKPNRNVKKSPNRFLLSRLLTEGNP